MEVALLIGDLGRLAVLLHEHVERVARDRRLAVGDEQVRELVVPGPQIGPQRLHLVRPQRVFAAVAGLDSVDRDPSLVEVEVVLREQPDLGGPQAVAIGDQEDGVVAATVGLGGLEQSPELLLVRWFSALMLMAF